MSTSVAIAGVALALLVAPLAVGLVAGRTVAPGSSYRRLPVLALICCLGLGVLAVMVAAATTPQSECHNTGCDTSYGVGAMFGAGLMYAPALLGVWLGRRLRPTLLV